MLAANEDSLARTTGIRPAKDFSGERPERKRNSAVWSFENLRGRLAELSGGPRSAVLTLSFRLVLEAQRLDEPVAWITEPRSTFFPPDVAANGIDLNALVVIRARCPGEENLRRRERRRQIEQLDNRRKNNRNTVENGSRPGSVWRAADFLVRSGGFGCVVVDLTRSRASNSKTCLPMPIQSRLAGLAKRHRSLLLFLTRESSASGAASLGPMISLHATAERTTKVGDRYACEVRILKDKKNGHRNALDGGSPGSQQHDNHQQQQLVPHGISWQHQELCLVPDGLR